jgi:hypothetical protein
MVKQQKPFAEYLEPIPVAGFLLLVGPSTSYVGPGDIVSGSIGWYSCARVYNAAAATISTSMCDLVDSAAPTVVVCTLRGSSTGYVDLTAYCPGSTTPAALCATKTGGKCNVSQMYDQSGSSHPMVEATASVQPVLVFSSLNGLPGITGVTANNTILGTSATITQTQPFSTSGVFKRTSVSGNFDAVMGLSLVGAILFGGGTTTGKASIDDDTIYSPASPAMPENAFTAMQAFYSGTSSLLTIDGTDSATGYAGTYGISGTVRIFRGNACCTMTGTIMETGIWNASFSSGNRTAMNANQHSATVGYNF